MKRGCLIELRRNRKGSMAIVFALALIPLLGFVGLATDYAKSLLVKRRLELAIDSAALASVKRTVDLLNDGQTSQSSAIQQGEAEGKAYMAAQSQRLMDTDLSAVNVKVTVDGSTITSQTGYAAGVPTAFAQLFGVKTFQIAGNSGASVTLSPYVDVHVLIDVSESMAIGATERDQDIITNMPVRRFWSGGSGVWQNGCAIACHIMQPDLMSNDRRYPSVTTYELAHQNGARMRIDVVRDAVQRLATTLLTRSDKRYRVALYTFNSSFNVLTGLTNNPTIAATAIATLEPASSQGGTNAHVAFRKLNSAIQPPGDGMTQDKAKAIVVLMTDGTEDTQMQYPGDTHDYTDPNFVYFDPYSEDFGGRIQSFDPQMCKPLKDKGAQFIALNTKYLIPKGQTNVKFIGLQTFLLKVIEKNMAACVSTPNDYYDASSPEEIDNAVSQITSSITKPLALTR
ncbi:TadE/TadG family type IV pilus assembly protein [Aureimonas sp. D3]|uniref:TadE/TadG family type IV pilus assembly protein n=1 Tax=Aureimonas sp. D3 TaxID=1638164 RepID=UPI0009EA120A|nr:TadE/TadG family type IV pilus assembly protein [Aureimonas sp. D3]